MQNILHAAIQCIHGARSSCGHSILSPVDRGTLTHFIYNNNIFLIFIFFYLYFGHITSFTWKTKRKYDYKKKSHAVSRTSLVPRPGSLTSWVRIPALQIVTGVHRGRAGEACQSIHAFLSHTIVTSTCAWAITPLSFSLPMTSQITVLSRFSV